MKDETRFDPRVRDCWEIPKSGISIAGRSWGHTLRPMIDRIQRDLGLADGSHLSAELHNLLVYGHRQFFLTHQDSEKIDRSQHDVLAVGRRADHGQLTRPDS